MYHVLGKKDHVKSRHAMCKRFEDWGEDRYWEEVFNRVRAFLLGKPGADGLVSRKAGGQCHHQIVKLSTFRCFRYRRPIR